MAIDTPARIAVLGAGPIGLEAALYARFLGYDVDIYDQGRVAEHVRRWGHVTLFSPFSWNTSTLGLAAISAQDSKYAAPSGDDLLTGHEFVEAYLLPLSKTDLLVDQLRLGTRVVEVTREGLPKEGSNGGDARVDANFSLLLEDAHGERRADADVVIDATGCDSTPCMMGNEGLPAVGERAFRDRIRHDLPDVLGHDRSTFSGAKSLVIGSGHSAATTVTALAALAVDDPETEVVWLTRKAQPDPIPLIQDDPLPARAQLTTTANRLARTPPRGVRFMNGCTVHRLSDGPGDQIKVEIEGVQTETLHVNQIVAHVGFEPDMRITAKLQVQYGRVAGAPIHFEPSLLESASSESGHNLVMEVEGLKTTEPRFFILGRKSFGRSSHFLMSHGREQIRCVFSFIAGREDLDLYSSVRNLLP